jgi:hypothetical protein
VVNAELGLSSLMLDNTDHATDPNGQFGLLPADIAKCQDITISVWVKWNGGNNWQRIIDFGAGETDNMFLTPKAQDAGLRFALKIGGGSEQQLNTSALTIGEWTHVAVTLDGNTGRLYVNGELMDTNPGLTNNPINLPQTANYVGKSQYPDAELNGLIDELKIYNYALTTAEIGQEYANLMDIWVCNNEVAALAYDFDGSCQVDIGDIAMFAVTWLESNRINP